MAKFRFPGKALKLNSRKRVKFRIGEEGNLDEHRISQIKSGLLLFNQLFGYSDEDEDEEEFKGFENPFDKTFIKKAKKIIKKPVVIEDKVEERSCDLQTNSSIDNNYDSDENEGDTCLSIAINGLYENASKKEAVILKNNQMCNVDDGDPNCEIVTEKVKDSKKVKENSERTSRKFVLPSVSARSSRIIKPNKRLFSDFSLTCSTNQQEEDPKIVAANESSIEQSSKLVNRSNLTAEQESEEEDDVKENDPVCRSITFYTDSITEEFKGQVGRPPKRLLRKGETQSKEELHLLNVTLSPSKDLKEDKVKEKIEKLLRSPWDNRIKQNAKVTGKEKDNGTGCFPLNNTTITKSILRKPRLNLNNQTLQKIRNPASVQHLVPLSEDEAAENKCGLCQIKGCNTVCRYGVSCCDTCSMSINFFSESLSTNLDCIGGQGECQLVGLSMEERCLACWLARILVTCAMPSLLHDRLRNCLSSPVRDRIPTSLGRSCNAISGTFEDATDGKGDNNVRNFGSLVDLPGGWKRKNGTNVIVISPSGEKFRSIFKLEEYLKRQGINAQASVLFGNLNPNASLNTDTKVSTKHSVKPQNKISNVVVTTLPGGWTRRIKWRSTGDMFDTYVGSPDGRTFRSRKELSSYFQHIGKVDDIYKYFPVKTSKASCENSEASSTEPVSSSEESVDEKSPHISDSEGEIIVANVNHLHGNKLQKNIESFEKSSEQDKENLCHGEENCANEEYKLEEKSEKVIISNFHSHLRSSVESSNSMQDNEVSAQDLEHSSIELSNISGKEETTMSSSYDSESDIESSGINLNLFSKKSESESSNLILKIKNVIPESGESGKESVGSKHKKKRKKKKKKHEKHTKDKRKNSENEKNLVLVSHVHKINMNGTEEAKSSSHLTSLNNDLNSCTNIPWHPNDTWQTLINPNLITSGSNAQNNFTDRSIKDNLEDKTESDVTNTLSTRHVKKLNKKPLKPQTHCGFTREQFGNGWGRKIKWNENGEGKVAFLTSPEGQRIVSSIELMAYFNKAGRTMLDLDHYFPKNITRTVSEEKELPVVSNEDALERLSPTFSVKEKNERRTKRNILYKQPKSVLSKGTLKGSVLKLKSSLLNKKKGKKLLVSSSGSEPLPSDVGPRVKHVCRSKAQVLGMPRAVFPSPEFKQQQQQQLSPQPVNDSVKRKLNLKKKATKFMSVLTPKGKRVLKKTVWCNKCPGCTTPNCKVCGNCLDMKKFGGPGTKKKPCIKRKCQNPMRAVKCLSHVDTSQFLDAEEEEECRQMADNHNSGPTSANSEFDITSDLLYENDCMERKSEIDEEDFPAVERPIFVPKLMKPSCEPKDKGDIQMGKECIPGTRVNIDYWQEYDAEEMLMSGFPIITSVPLQIDSFCFRCGSAGLEQLLYCIWCCEGVHPFCLEEGEGPENDEDEAFWVCRKCAVCHVCGGSGHYDLLQCSGCRKHYHLECLGPTSHQSCQPTQEGVWLCVRCIKCHGCGSPNVVDWINLEEELSPNKNRRLNDSFLQNLRPFCQRCFQLRESKNFCPLCQGCYEDDDFDSKMMECGKCKEWVHAQCEGITDEWYQVLSFLPDSVEFVCKLCLEDGHSQWREAIKLEMQESLKAVFDGLYSSKCAKHLMQLSSKSTLNKKAKMNSCCTNMNSKFAKEKKVDGEKEKKSDAYLEIAASESIGAVVGHSVTDSSTKPIDLLPSVAKSTACQNNESSNIYSASLPCQSLGRDLPSETNSNPQIAQAFERPKTRSCTSTTQPQNEGDDSLPQNSLTSTENNNESSCIIYPSDEVSLKKCSVRLEDICKNKKAASNIIDSALSVGIQLDLKITEQENTAESKDADQGVQSRNEDTKIVTGQPKKMANDDKGDSQDANKSSEKLITPLKNFLSCYMSDFEEDEETKKVKKNSPYSMVAKVSKDIDDDCVSSEESSFCSSDTEIESIFDDPFDPKDLHDIKNKLIEEKYESVVHFYVDVMRVIEMGKTLNRVQTRNVKTAYLKNMKEKFPWFNINELNIFSLIDGNHPFPLPYNEHNYPNLKCCDRTSSSLSWKRSSSSRLESSSKTSNHTRVSSPNKKQKSGLLQGDDPRKCLLCNSNGDADPNEAGRLLYLGQDEWLHVNCGLWSSEVYEEEDGGLQNVYVAVSRGRQIKCSLCQERGATVGCCYRFCQATYHFMCARNSGCFFGEDKRIFCQSHTSPEDLKCIEDLRVGRCVFVNMDFEKRRWRQALTNKVNVIIGSLFINSLGKMVPDIDFDDALIPTDFSCSRMFWSTKDPTIRVKYFCRTRLIFPANGSADGLCESMFHKTIDHSMSQEMVEKQMAEVKVWQKEMDRQKWERQSRHTNIIPPHLCPLYRNIMKEERKNANKDQTIGTRKAYNPARRQLFSPLPSTSSSEEKENDDVRLCVDDILNRISHSVNLPAVQEEAEILPVAQPLDENDMNIPSTDENSEIMASIVNADDNEIISMVLKDLAVFESSVFQSTPSTSGRASPLDLDFLAVCDPTINSDEKQSYDSDSFKQERKTPQKSDEREKYCPSSSYVEKSFLEEPDNAEAQLICQKILEACDSQMQNQIITFDQDNSVTPSNPVELYSVIPTEAIHQGPISSYLQNFNSFSSLPLNTISQDLPQQINFQPPMPQQNYKQVYEPNSNVMPNTFLHETSEMRSSMFSQSSQKNNYASVGNTLDCRSALSSNGVNIYSQEDCKKFYMPDSFKNPMPTQCYSNIFQSGNNFASNLEEFNPPSHSSGFQICPNLSSFQLPDEHPKMNVGRQNSFEEPHIRNAEVDKPVQTLSRDIPRPASVPLDSTFTLANSSGSSCSSVKQVCRVLPMLSSSAGSRRGSSASDHSDSGNFPVSEIKSPVNVENSRTENVSSNKPVIEAEQKKRKIHMKRNYRTVIKKYPLRSALRKRTPYKTVQIEINETIEIPSEDDETVCRRSLKRKWSSEVIDTKSDKTSVDVCSSRRGRRPFRTSVAGGSTNTFDQSEDVDAEKETTKEDGNDGSRSTSKRSHQVLKFSDDHNAITVSIVNNNNLCDFAKRKRRHRFRRKTVLQLDGAADDSSSDAASNDDQGIKQSNHPIPNLALRIKQQSLARSSPGEEGPFKCSKCKRLYRTRDSYNRHIETCNFEIDSSTSSEEGEKEGDQNALYKSKGHNNSSATTALSEIRKQLVVPLDFVPKNTLNADTETSKYLHVLSSSKNINMTTSENEKKRIASTNLKKLEEMCSTPLFEDSFSSGKTQSGDTKPETTDTDRLPGIHRQVRIAMRRTSDMKSGGEELQPSCVASSEQPQSNGSEVFVPPTLSSPVKFNPVVKKSSSPRRYTNVRLFKGRQGYQYRRAPPQLLTPQQQQQQQHPQQQQQQQQQQHHIHNQQITQQQPLHQQQQHFQQPQPQQSLQHQFQHQQQQQQQIQQQQLPNQHIQQQQLPNQQIQQQQLPNHQIQQQQLQQIQQQQQQQHPLQQHHHPQQLSHEHTFHPQSQVQFQTSQIQFRGQESSMPITIQPLLDQAFRVQTPHPSSQYASPINAALPQITRDLGTSITPLAQVMTVVSGPSVAIPQGYTLQYVGSFREGEIRNNASNLMAYQSPQQMVVPSSLVVAPQPSPIVMPQVVNTNITYTIATPEGLLINQPAVVPNVQYVTQQQQPSYQQPMIQTLGTVVPFNQPRVQHISHSIQSLTQPIPSVAVQHISSSDRTLSGPSPPMLSNTSSITISGNSSQILPSSPCSRPQAFIAPISLDSSKEPSRCLKVETSPTSSSRPLFGQTVSVTRSVATVAPAVFTTSTAVVSKPSLSSCSVIKTIDQCLTVKDPIDFTNILTDAQSRIAAVRPRPTYSYRDAMKGTVLPEKKRPRCEEKDVAAPPSLGKKKDEKSTSEVDTDSEKDEKQTVDKKKNDVKEVQSYQLVLKKNNQSGSKFNILPLSGPKVALPSPEVKELRIKAKVSVGPKRKKVSGSSTNEPWGQCGKDFMVVNKDTTNDMLVNEQQPNMSLNFSPSQPIPDDTLFDKPKASTTEPYIIFELTSDDGFKFESRHVSEVWQKVFDAVSEARDNLRMGTKRDNGSAEAQGKNVSGLQMLGLTHSAVQYLLEQLPGAKDCHKYSFQFHRRPIEEDTFESASGCARSESFKTRSPYDVFSWLASKHRKLPLKSRVQQEEIQLSTRRATSMELPMAMRYRHLCETAREAVGVFRSSIHGRGLFCKREIDAGEMVIEYAGQVIRSCLCDMREKFYESKGIGCYMFRIDDEIVIDATMHGNAARFINHSCDPNCYSRVVDILGKKHIIIFALRRIQRGEELTYDYKFPIEDDKIPCSCGARRCRKYLN